MAAPETPQRHTNMKMGSKIMFVRSPTTVDSKEEEELTHDISTKTNREMDDYQWHKEEFSYP